MSEPDRNQGKGAPSQAERGYLRLGLNQPGRKLPLFDGEGQSISPHLIRNCLAKGWAERWFSNPLAPEWLVCRLTERGVRAAISEEPAATDSPCG